MFFLGSSDVVIVTTDRTSKFDQLHSVRYKLEHNQLSRLKPESDKISVFQTLNNHLQCDSNDLEVKQFAVQLIHDILPHVGQGYINKVSEKLCPGTSLTLILKGLTLKK